jgi:hypothetical protein
LSNAAVSGLLEYQVPDYSDYTVFTIHSNFYTILKMDPSAVTYKSFICLLVCIKLIETAKGNCYNLYQKHVI